MQPGAITVEMVIAFITIVGAIGGVWWRIEAKFTAFSDELRRARDDLADYKLHVAQTHVSIPTLKDTEERLITAIDKLANRLEMIVTRIEKIPTR